MDCDRERPHRPILANLTLDRPGSAPASPSPFLPDEEIQDLLFLGDDRPILIRLRIRVDGEGHRGRWREFVRRLHAEADADRDGTVTRSEANKAIELVSQMQAGPAFVGQLPAPRRRPLVAPQIVTVDYMLDQIRAVTKAFQIGRVALLRCRPTKPLSASSIGTTTATSRARNSRRSPRRWPVLIGTTTS